MIVDKLKTLFGPVWGATTKECDQYLKDVSGVVHVGANLGQERKLYDSLGLNVPWIEPIPKVFAQLTANIRNFKNQRAFQALVTDVDEKEYDFHIADNKGASSSILEFKQHKDIWPGVGFVSTIRLKSTTLATLFKREQVDAGKYQALVMDTQGSELLVLRGSVPILHHFKYIKTEVADFESYKGCCQLPDINQFMAEHGYSEMFRQKFASHAEGGGYFNIVYKKQA
jgi:FkbM family methyltransferase